MRPEDPARQLFDAEGNLVGAERTSFLPTRVHAIVLVSKLHKPALLALAYAKAARPNTLEAVVVDTDPVATGHLLEEWDDMGLDIPLKVLYSPYSQIVKPPRPPSSERGEQTESCDSRRL